MQQLLTTMKIRLPSPVTVVRDKQCSLAMAAPQPNRDREKPHSGLDHRIGHFASMRFQKNERLTPKRG